MLTQLLRVKLKNEVKRVGQLELSDKSRKFIGDLKLYLFSSGKNELEIKNITEELEEHLYDAELNGKSIDQIIGVSPKEYIMSISTEMKTDYKAWAKYIPLIIIGAMSFIVLGDFLQGTLRYSLLKIIGTLIYSIIFIVGLFTAFRYMAGNQVSKIKGYLILLLPIFISTLFFGGVIIADSIYNTPIVVFGVLGSILIGLLFLSFVVLISIWAKTAVLPVIIFAYHLPTILLSLTSINEGMQLIIGFVITYLLIGVYLLYVVKKDKREIEIIE